MAIWGILLNSTLRAAVHLGQDYEANLRYVKNHLWNSVGQLFNETGKLISEQKEISGVNTFKFKDSTWMSTSLLCSKAYQITNAKAYLFSDSALCGEKLEMILLQQLEESNEMVFGKQSLQGYESNRWYADRVPVENIPRNHNVGPPREDSKSNETYSV